MHIDPVQVAGAQHVCELQICPAIVHAAHLPPEHTSVPLHMPPAQHGMPRLPQNVHAPLEHTVPVPLHVPPAQHG
jgi:hypothetical protein